jgi:hypothetical protein
MEAAVIGIAALIGVALSGMAGIAAPQANLQPTTAHSPSDRAQTALRPAVTRSLADRPHPVAAASGPGLRLALKFKVGDITRYRTGAQVEAHLPAVAGGVPTPIYSIRMDLEEQEKVARVLPDGSGDLEVSTLSGTGTLNGQPFSPHVTSPGDKISTVTFTPLGDLVRVSDLPGDANMPVIGNLLGAGALSMHGVCLTAHPVRPGDVWNKTIKFTGMTGNGVATVKSSFVREEQVGRYRTARIHSLFSAPIHAWVDASAQPTMKQQAAANALVGTLNIIYDMNLAIAEGKVVRSAGAGRVSVTIQPMNAPAPTANRPKSHAPAPPAGATHMEMTLHVGSNLQE